MYILYNFLARVYKSSTTAAKVQEGMKNIIFWILLFAKVIEKDGSSLEFVIDIFYYFVGYFYVAIKLCHVFKNLLIVTMNFKPVSQLASQLISQLGASHAVTHSVNEKISQLISHLASHLKKCQCAHHSTIQPAKSNHLY